MHTSILTLCEKSCPMSIQKKPRFCKNCQAEHLPWTGKKRMEQRSRISQVGITNFFAEFTPENMSDLDNSNKGKHSAARLYQMIVSSWRDRCTIGWMIWKDSQVATAFCTENLLPRSNNSLGGTNLSTNHKWSLNLPCRYVIALYGRKWLGLKCVTELCPTQAPHI